MLDATRLESWRLDITELFGDIRILCRIFGSRVDRDLIESDLRFTGASQRFVADRLMLEQFF